MNKTRRRFVFVFECISFIEAKKSDFSLWCVGLHCVHNITVLRMQIHSERMFLIHVRCLQFCRYLLDTSFSMYRLILLLLLFYLYSTAFNFYYCLSVFHFMLSMLFAQFHLIIKALESERKKCREIILLPQTVCRWSRWRKRKERKTACHSYRIRNNKSTHKAKEGKEEQSKHEIRSNTFSSFVLPSIKKMVQRIEYHSFSFFHSQTRSLIRLLAQLKNKWCVRAIAIVIIWYFCHRCCCCCCCHSHRLPSM